MQKIHTEGAGEIAALLKERYSSHYVCPDNHPDLDDPELSGGRRLYASHQTQSWKDEFIRKASQVLLRVNEQDVPNFLQCFDLWINENISATWYVRYFMFKDLFQLYENSGSIAVKYFERIAMLPNQSSMWGDAVHEHDDYTVKCLKIILEIPPRFRIKVLRQLVNTMNRLQNHAGHLARSFGQASWVIQDKLRSLGNSGASVSILPYMDDVIQACEEDIGGSYHDLERRIHEIGEGYRSNKHHILAYIQHLLDKMLRR